MTSLTKTSIPSPAAGEAVARVRAFNRFYTNVIGVLREGLLRTPYSLTEARVIFELGQRETAEVSDLRRILDVDAGYLSRILARFEADGIITKQRSKTDGRRQIIELTDRGRATFEMLDRRSAEQVEALLSGINEADRRRLLGAMDAVQGILEASPSPRPFVIRPAASGDYGWVVHRHGVLYREEHGWDERFEALVARIVADFVDNRDHEREAAWIAELDGEPVGCVLCVKKEDKVAQLRLMLTEPRARRMGIGTRLVEECIRFARRAGYEQMVLWTNDVLVEARRIYERFGFELAEEEKHHSFGKDLVGQNWQLEL
jgi:DNA-binding MarR family transcriptional regulator/predicted N-acetyltransferase YhbS